MNATALRFVSVLERMRVAIDPITRRWLGSPLDDAQAADAGMRPFELEADALISRQRTHRAQKIVRAALAVTVMLVIWAALAHVDEVTRGDARVIPSRQLQVVQSLDGGIVSEILVREGQVVEAGQLLLRVEETRATAGVRESAATGVTLRARAARLRALAEGKPFQPPTAQSDEERRVIEEERRLYAARLNELEAQLAVVRQQMAQRQQEQSEAQAKRTAAQRGLELSQQELAQTRPLLASGAVSQVDILRLERDITKFRGEVEQVGGADRARAGRDGRVAAQGAGGRADLPQRGARRARRGHRQAQCAHRKRRRPGRQGGQDRRSRAPCAAACSACWPTPSAASCSRARTSSRSCRSTTRWCSKRACSRSDIAFIRPDQQATVKFSAYDFSIYGGLEAKVENISPDTIVDEKGNAFYLVRVRTTKVGFTDKLPIIPGMTAEVDVLTGNKSVLSYLLKPVLKVRDGALRER